MRGFRAEHVEARVWELVRFLMLEPKHLQEDIERMIEEERTSAVRGDPEQEASHWLDRLAEADSEQRGFLRLAARGSITDAELDEALAPEERHQLYQLLRLRVTADANRNLTAEGMFGEVSVSDESSTWMPALGSWLRRVAFNCRVFHPS